MDRANPSVPSGFSRSIPTTGGRPADKDIAPEIGGREQKQTPPASPGKCSCGGRGRKAGRKTMSCFIMNENRIAALAHEIITRNKGDLLVGEQGDTYGRERLADAMLAMNLDAFQQRYGMKTLLKDLDSIDLDTRTWKPLEAFSEVQFFKSLQCFLYQCTEGDVDEKPLYKPLSAIQNLLAPFINTDSPQYDAAEWG